MFGLAPNQPMFGLSPEKSDALRMALLQAGLGIMSARTGGNLGAAIGQGGMMGLQAYQAEVDRQRQQKRAEAQDAMAQQQFGMQQERFGLEKQRASTELESAQAAEARRKAFGEAVQGAYIRDEAGNITGIDQARYQAALSQFDPEAAARMFYNQQTADRSYFQALPTASGYMRFNARTGEAEPIQMGGAPIVRPQDDPNLQRQIAGATAGGRLAGESATQAQIDLPAVQSNAAAIISAIDEVAQHPGRASATGASRMLGMQKVPGTSAYDFDAKVANLQGKVFKEAFQSMKGAGAITEQEGKAAERAIANFDAAQSEQQFAAALDALKAEILRLRDVAAIRAGRGSPDQPLNLQLQGMPQPQQGGGWGIREIR